MRTISIEKIESLLKDCFPNLIDWNPTDEQYSVVNDLQKLIDEFPALPWKAGVYECEEIAKSFVTDVRKWEAQTDQAINRAIGVANCTIVRGVEMGHTINVAITPEGVMLFDMQTGESWAAERGQDDIYFVEM